MRPRADGAVARRTGRRVRTRQAVRPYRDVRFSANKEPYKTNCAATLGQGVGQAYLSFSADALSVGGGLYLPDPATLQRCSDAVDREKSGAELAGIVDDLHRAGYQTMAHAVLKTAPKGFPRTIPASSCSGTKASR